MTLKRDPIHAPRSYPPLRSTSVPVVKRTEIEEDMWWMRVAAERGTILQVWDSRRKER